MYNYATCQETTDSPEGKLCPLSPSIFSNPDILCALQPAHQIDSLQVSWWKVLGTVAHGFIMKKDDSSQSHRPSSVDEEEAVGKTVGHISTAYHDQMGEEEVQGVDFPPSGSVEDRDALLSPVPPDGGFNAWFQVALAHLINQNTFGYASSYGIFQGYYTETLKYSASTVAWIGTVNLCLLYLVGVFSGRAMDTGYYRACTAAGLFLQLVGVFMTSISTKYWQLMLAQGICQGIGNGLLFCPAVANVATYFSVRKRALAVSFVACGGATGGMIFPAIAQSLLHRIGFGWTLRVMGLVMLFNTILVVLFSRTRLPPKPAAPLLDWEAFRELAFVLYCLGIFLVFLGTWIPYYFIRPFALDVLHGSQKTSFDLLLLLNGVGIPGRVLPALLSDRLFGPVNVLFVSSVVAGILLFCWIVVDSIGGLYAWDAFFGFAAGGIQALTLASASSFTPDMSKVGSRVGVAFIALGLSGLIGPPCGGALIRDGSWLSTQIFAGVAMMTGSAALAVARLVQTGSHLKRRV